MRTATTKDVNSIKKRVNQLIEAQATQQKTLVHIISTLNAMQYAAKVNRHSINVLMDKVDETVHNVNNLYNLTTSLMTSFSYHQLILHIRSVLANLWDSLSYIRTVSMHTMDYIDAATTGTLSPHFLPITDLQKMLSHIEETLPLTLQPVADINLSASKSHNIPTIQKVTKDSTDFPVHEQLITNKTEAITRRKIQGKSRKQPFHPDLIYRPPPWPPDNLRPNHPESELDTMPKIDVEFEENSPHQEGIISEFHQRPNKSYLQEPKDLESLVNTSNLVQRFLPK